MIAKLLLLAKLVDTLAGEHCHCLGRHLVLCVGKIQSDKVCPEAAHLLFLNGDSAAFPANFSEFLPNLQRVDVEGFDGACHQASFLPILVVCHPIISPQAEKLVYDRALIWHVNGLSELRALVGVSAFSLLLQIILLCGGLRLALLIKPLLSFFSSSSS